MIVKGPFVRALGLPALALGLFLILISACHVDQPPGREEKYVTVRLHDSLSRFDSIEVLILAGGDPAKVIGKVWDGRLLAPGAIPSFRVDDGEQRDLVISVKGWDADGRLALIETIAIVDGKQVVTGTPVAQPSPRLKSMTLDSGNLEPAFQPAQHAYAVAVPYGKAALRIAAVPEYSPADIVIGLIKTPAGSQSEDIPLEVGENRVTVTVRAADTTDQYVITATRAPKPDDSVIVPPKDTVIVIPPKPDSVRPDPNLYKSWKYKGVILLNFLQVGLPPSFKVLDFPLLVRLNRDNFDFSQAAERGGDVRFATSTGKFLPYEISRWDAGSQTAEIFVRIDTLTYAKAGSIIMYWGNSAATTTGSPSRVFEAAAGWGGVWHLEENGLEDDYLDATGENLGRGEGGIPVLKEGVVGMGQDFTSDNSPDWIEMPRDYDLGVDAFTMHMWVKKAGTGHYRLLSKDGTASNDQRFLFDVAANTGRFSFGSNGVMHDANLYIGVGNWVLLGLTFDGTKAHLFVDGAERESWNYKVIGRAYNKVILGAYDDEGLHGFHGMLDEFWSSPVDRGKDYMRLIFENQKAWSNFATLLPL